MLAKKTLGQHFLRCQWVMSTLLSAADINKSDIVLEVGPGTGVLTRILAQNAGRVIAVEKDETLAERLRAENVPKTTVVTGDILQMLKCKPKPCPKLNLGQGDYKVVANIPYYLTSRLIRLLLEQDPKPKKIVFTVQKEVAQRICAKPPKMNLLALSVQAFGKPELIKMVPANCFWPKPKVDSAIIKISDISNQFFLKNALDENIFFRVIRRAFSQKRKMITSSLRPLLGKHHALDIGKARPQELNLQQWVNIITEIKNGI